MEQQFCELLIKRKGPAGGKNLVYGCLGLAVIVLIAGIIVFWPLIAAAVLLVILAAALWSKGNTEFEYSYVGGELRIDRIIAQSRRKHLITLEADGVQAVAPEGADVLKNFGRGNGAVKDFTSQEPGAKVYVMVYEKGGQAFRVRLEPNEAMLNMMKLAMPRKITL